MKLIIAGSRTISPNTQMLSQIINFFGLDTKISEVVSGTAKGVDQAGEKWQLEMLKLCGNLAPKLVKFPPEWDTFGKVAGPMRNTEMSLYADALLLIWDGKSRGSAHMRQQMEKRGKPVYEIIIKAP